LIARLPVISMVCVSIPMFAAAILVSLESSVRSIAVAMVMAPVQLPELPNRTALAIWDTRGLLHHLPVFLTLCLKALRVALSLV